MYRNLAEKGQEQDVGRYRADEERIRRKETRKQELEENRMRLTESEKKDGRELRRRKIRRILLGIAAALIALVVIGTVRYRRAGETNGGRFWIWENRGDGGVNIVGQEADLLMLVNKDHALPENYLPRLHWLENKSCAVAEEMYPSALRTMPEPSEP